MKKFFFTFAALLAIAAVSCQREIATPEELVNENENQTEVTGPGEGVVVFSASLPGATGSKTVIGVPDGEGLYTPLWTSSDRIIVNGVKSKAPELIDGGTSANFTVEAVVAPYLALAPGSLNSAANYAYDPENNSYDYVVPGAGRPQTYTEGTYDPNNAVIAAYSTDNTLAFHHLCAYYKITVSGESDDDDNIRYIYIRQGDGSNLAGTWTASFDSENGISIAPKGTLSSVITLDCGEEGIAHGKPMIVAVPAYNFASGLIITLKDINGHFCSYAMKATATQFAANAGTVYNFKPVFSPQSGTISSADDWNAFAAALNSGKDYELYRWVGNGEVKLGADFEATNLTRISSWPAGYTFDGNGKTITRTAATTNLFNSISGTVKNLTLAGTLNVSSQTGPLAYKLQDSGLVKDCTNEMAINFSGANHAYVGGLVCIMEGGSIEGCINSGSINVAVDLSSANKSIGVGGIVGQVNPSAADVSLKDCTNLETGTITVIPATDGTYGAPVFGMGGITGWLRKTSYKVTISNCDNHAPVSISADGISSTTGGKRFECCLGGIVGIGSHLVTDAQSSSLGALNTPSGSNGLLVSISDCDNDGLLTNCYAIESDGSQNYRKIFTGGIAGSLVGNSDDYIELDKCTNTGNIKTYNLSGEGTATTPGYSQIAGGLVGYGGYLDISDSWVVCTIGERKRAAFAYAGVIGIALCSFSVDNTTVWITLNMVRLKAANCNNASIATVPYKFTNTLVPAPNFGNTESATITLSGISITNCKIGGSLTYFDLTTPSDYTNTDDKSGESSKSLEYHNASREIRGNGVPSSYTGTATNITTTPSGVVKTGTTYITADPTPAP